MKNENMLPWMGQTDINERMTLEIEGFDGEI